jgi:hypothetical protein
MRSGNKPRRRPAAGTVEAPPSLKPVAADDQPGTQLPLESLEEPAEILVRFSTAEPDAAAQPVAEPVAEGESAAQPVAEPLPESGAAEPSEAITSDFAAGPTAYQPAESGPVEDASLLMRLARIHLRTGSLTTARAQLEALAGRNLLDSAGMLDLAEVRWRTGDLRGAGEAAGAYLAANGGEALGLVIAAEAAALDNHDGEARRHMEQALLRTLTSLDAIFAGVPHRLTLTQSGPETTAAPEETPAADSPRTMAAAEPAAVAAENGPAAESVAVAAEPAVEPRSEAENVGTAAEAETAAAPAELVPEAAGTPATEASTAAAPAQPVVDSGRGQADTEIAAGIALLETGDALLAALHFGIALRMTPESAQAVLGAIGDRHDLALELVRGDALRMQGHERDAGQAYQSVASALSRARTAAETPTETPAEAAAETPTETPAEAAAETPTETPAEAAAETPTETPAEAAAETPAEAAAETAVEPATEIPAEAAEVPAEQAATDPTHAPQEADNPEPRLLEPAPPISWLD